MGKRHIEIREIVVMSSNLLGEADLLCGGAGIAEQDRGAVLSVQNPVVVPPEPTERAPDRRLRISVPSRRRIQDAVAVRPSSESSRELLEPSR